MKLTIKNLQQQTFVVEFPAEKKVSELKEQIFAERGAEYVVEKQKLIYAGVILDDERSVASYNVDEKKFIVVMIKRDVGGGKIKAEEHQPIQDTAENKQSAEVKADKPIDNNTKSGTAEEATTTTAAATNATVTNDAAVTSATKEESNTQSGDSRSIETAATNKGGAPLAIPAPTIQSQLAASNLLMGPEYNRTVESIVEMGYSREQVERAMGASYNNPERAVEYLISGIPEETGDGLNPPASMVLGSSGGGPGGVGTGSGASATAGEDPFEFLRNQPQFLQMRSLVYQNPDLLHAVLQQIGQTNPALLQLISENQDAFLTMLNQPLEGQVQQGTASERGSGNAGSEGTREVATTDNPSQNESRIESSARENIDRGVVGETVATIHLSQEDQEAIDRLKALGFPEALVLQAYFACEKNEQLAANFLISSAFED